MKKTRYAPNSNHKTSRFDSILATSSFVPSTMVLIASYIARSVVSSSETSKLIITYVFLLG